ncbi:unnamed protein product [Cercopithifilaria johnstoni]|uniref:Uncharacterized protein n=1 Tax=Cercopithifilaria johnstoni TaxID=2874296 RepID=A0A8J2M033_9BILA|nr:unnamed protein product [Cercopithifilaria johnstoni]
MGHYANRDVNQSIIPLAVDRYILEHPLPIYMSSPVLVYLVPSGLQYATRAIVQEAITATFTIAALSTWFLSCAFQISRLHCLTVTRSMMLGLRIE